MKHETTGPNQTSTAASWGTIDRAGDFPEYELGFQLIPEEDELEFNFNLLDPTEPDPGRTGARSACRQNGAQSQSG
ncbi:hypothetical protein ACNKHT_09445 [Shigella flexneri]